MATKKINEDALILKATKAVNKDLGISAKTPATKMKSFNEKVKAAPTPFIYRIKNVWKAFAALMAGFFTIGFIVARVTLPTDVALKTAYVSPDLYEFNTFDANGNGELNLAEVRKAKEALALRQFEYADTDENAQLDFEESKIAVNEILENQFNALDLDKNGELSFDEIDEKIAYIDEEQFNQLDKNKNGQLNYAEVQELFIIFIIEG